MAQNQLPQIDNLFSRSGFPSTSAFYKNSEDHSLKLDVVGVIPADDQKVDKKDAVDVPIKQIEDWVYRLLNFANEAYDEHLGALESDLLDMREEMNRLLD